MTEDTNLATGGRQYPVNLVSMYGTKGARAGVDAALFKLQEQIFWCSVYDYSPTGNDVDFSEIVKVCGRESPLVGLVAGRLSQSDNLFVRDCAQRFQGQVA